ncbi:MAG: MFS transporter [Siphonobacter sp.]
MFSKNEPKVINAWCFYDWANSVHALVIVTAIFPIYFGATAVTRSPDWVDFFGAEFRNSVVFSYAISAAFLIIALTSPICSAMADYSGRKKLFMKIFCYFGSANSLLLYFFTKETYAISTLFFVFSLIGWAGSIVFYNSFLPEIVTEDRFDAVSARGFSMGYIGSVLLLIFNLTMILKPQWYGLSEPSLPPRISFLLVGVWWAGFAQYTFAHLPEHSHGNNTKASGWLFNGFKELAKVFHQVRNLLLLKRFLVAYFCYNMGVQTVMYLATLFGDKELHLDSGSLITVLLLIQLVAILGAWLFSKLSALAGNFQALRIAVLIWIGICVAAYFVATENQFYGLAFVVGLVMGGIQSLSRSTYAKLLPRYTPDTASFFSFYDVCDKISTVLGTFMYGFIIQLTGSMRYSVLFIGGIFVLGFMMLLFLPNLKKYRPNIASA